MFHSVIFHRRIIKHLKACGHGYQDFDQSSTLVNSDFVQLDDILFRLLVLVRYIECSSIGLFISSNPTVPGVTSPFEIRRNFSTKPYASFYLIQTLTGQVPKLYFQSTRSRVRPSSEWTRLICLSGPFRV